MEQRKKPRIETKIKIIFDGFGSSAEILTGNISRTGLFLETLLPLGNVGDRFEIAFCLPKSETWVRAKTRVARITVPNQLGKTKGVALEFLRLDPKHQEILDELIEAAFEVQGIGSRKSPRLTTEVLLEIATQKDAQKAMTENFSREGMFIKTNTAGFSLGDALQVIVLHPSSNRKMSVEGRIVHIRHGETKLNRTFYEGIGISFSHLQKAKKQDLLNFFKSILKYYKKSRFREEKRVS